MGERTASVREAAAVLGFSPEAVRKRLARGTLRGQKVDSDWTVYIPDVQDGIRDGRETTAPDSGEVARLRSEVAWLREEVQRKDAILLSLTQRVPALPAPAEAPKKRRWDFWRR